MRYDKNIINMMDYVYRCLCEYPEGIGYDDLLKVVQKGKYSNYLKNESCLSHALILLQANGGCESVTKTPLLGERSVNLYAISMEQDPLPEDERKSISNFSTFDDFLELIVRHPGKKMYELWGIIRNGYLARSITFPTAAKLLFEVYNDINVGINIRLYENKWFFKMPIDKAIELGFSDQVIRRMKSWGWE